MIPRWLQAFEAARQQGVNTLVLVFNTTDLVFAPETGIEAPARLPHFIAQYLGRHGFATALYSLTTGLEELRPPGINVPSPFGGISSGQNPEQVLNSLTGILRRKDHKVVLIVDYADHLAPASVGATALLSTLHVHAIETLHRWSVDDQIRASDNLVILLSHENQINDLLIRNGGYQVIPIDLPDREERAGVIERICRARETGRTDYGPLAEGFSPEGLSRASGGLRILDLFSLFREAAAGVALGLEAVRRKKAEVIRQLARNLLEVSEPVQSLTDLAGIPHVKEYFRSLVWRAGHGDSTLPQAILMQGPPGTGKSYGVGALAHALGYPLLAMRAVRDMWVGASERNLELVLWVAETLAPCILWIDEVDQILGQRTTGQSADAGTSERMLARIWEFLGAMRHRGQVLWVATTNRPDLLDPALLDRFQVTLPYLHPTTSEIEELLPVLARQLGRELANDVDARQVVQHLGSSSITVRSLQEIVGQAATWSDQDAERVGTQVGQRHIVEAARDFKPNYNLLEHEMIALVTVRMTSFHSLLPWRSRSGLRPGTEVPHYLKDLVDPETGEVDSRALDNRIRDLQESLLASRVRRAA